MLGKLKAMFGPKKPGGSARPRRGRVNIQRRFTLLAMTAQGSMSRVHRAIDNSTGSTVCLKVQIIDKHAAVAARSSVGRPDEGDICMKINHPHVVKTYDYGMTTQNEHFLVME